MVKKITFGGHSNAKKRIFTIWQEGQFYNELFTQFPDDDIRITIQKAEKTRSLQQLRYYRGVFLIEAQNAWNQAGYNYSIDRIDVMMKQDFFHSEFIDELTGKVYKEPWSMADGGGVSTTDFNQKKELAQQWYAENLHYSIPDPNEITDK